MSRQLARIRADIEHAAGGRKVELVAVSKLQSAAAVRQLAELGQRAFGENYVQEAAAKQVALAGLALEWHLIGPLQSNKCREAAQLFDWVQSLDRLKLVALLAKARPADRPALNVLIQVNIGDEASKSGCKLAELPALVDAISAAASLRLRGLMAIPAPWPDQDRRRADFRRMRQLFEDLRQQHDSVDTLSMGMSEDFELAIAEGASMVRVGSALFGARQTRQV